MSSRTVFISVHESIMALGRHLPKLRADKAGAFLINCVRVISIISMLAPNLILGAETVSAAAEAWFPPGVESASENPIEDGNKFGDMLSSGDQVPILSEVLAAQAQSPTRLPSIKLWANPAILLPDKPVQLHWQVRNWDQVKDTKDINLTINIPEGLTPQSSALADALDANRDLKISVTQPAGQIVLEVDSDFSPPFSINALLIVEGEVVNGNAILLDTGKFEIPSAGGTFEAFGGNVRINVPEKASGQGLVFDVRSPSPNKMPAVSLTGRPVEVIAAGQATGLEVPSSANRSLYK